MQKVLISSKKMFLDPSRVNFQSNKKVKVNGLITRYNESKFVLRFLHFFTALYILRTLFHYPTKKLILFLNNQFLNKLIFY